MANVRIKNLPADAAPNKNDVLAVDSLTTRGVTIENAVKIGRPFASQAEAEAGTDYTKAMNPLTVKQELYALGDARFATVAQGSKADSAIQPATFTPIADKANSAVQTLVAGQSTSIDATDPQNPVVAFTGTGTGDMLGPSSSADAHVALFDGTTGKLVKDGGATGTTGLAVLAATNVAAAQTALGTPLTANTMLVDNAAGTAREAKTFAEVQTLLGLPWIEAAKHGVVGDGVTDDGPALQTIIDGLDANFGGTILLPAGDVLINTPIDMAGRTQIQISGQGGGASNGGKTMVSTSLAAVPNTRLFDLRGANNTTFRDIWFHTLSTSFSGWFFDLDRNPVGGWDNTYTRFIDCNFFSRSVNCVFHMLQGSTRGVMERCIWGGDGILVYGARTSAPVAFAGVWNFISCDFKPTGVETNGAAGYPIFSPGGGWVFTNCNVQAGSVTGKGRFILGADSVKTDTEALNLLGCTFYDVVSDGGVWIDIKRGSGIVIQGCFAGGSAGTYFLSLGGNTTVGDPNLDGVRGVTVMGNTINTMGTFIGFQGNAGSGTGVRNILVSSNYLQNVTTPFSGIAVAAKQLISLGNQHYGSTTSYGATLVFWGFPIYANRTAAIAAGLAQGQGYLSQAVSGENVLAVV